MLVRQISAEIYSWCDITNELFINLFRDDIRYRGSNLSNSYNANFKKIYKASIGNIILSGVHSNNDLNKFYFDSQKWFVLFHDIRTQETHYEVGTIIKDSGQLIYKNNNRNGVSRSLYSNPSSTINIPIQKFISFIDEFLDYKEGLCSIIKSKIC